MATRQQRGLWGAILNFRRRRKRRRKKMAARHSGLVGTKMQSPPQSIMNALK